MTVHAGFLPGAGVGAGVALAGMFLAGPPQQVGRAALGDWLALNLGHSSWLFAAVLVFYVVHLGRLRRLLMDAAERRRVVELDQLTDVWIHLFVGIGVIWTAVGMRSALQFALADPDHALADTAGSVLKRLVDGGLLLALSTTILGAVGGYLMRLGKTLYAGAALHEFYDRERRGDVRDLLAAVERLECKLTAAGEDAHAAR